MDFQKITTRSRFMVIIIIMARFIQHHHRLVRSDQVECVCVSKISQRGTKKLKEENVTNVLQPNWKLPRGPKAELWLIVGAHGVFVTCCWWLHITFIGSTFSVTDFLWWWVDELEWNERRRSSRLRWKCVVFNAEYFMIHIGDKRELGEGETAQKWHLTCDGS